MGMLRGLLFDNLGLKLVALLLAVLVYLNVYTDRPATMIVSFPIQVVDLADSLSLSGPAPAAVQAELRGTAKQLIRLRITEPPVRLSLAGVGTGRYERAVGPEDLPLPDGVELQVDRMVSPRTIELRVDRRVARELAVSARIEGSPASGVLWDGGYELQPPRVTVVGPQASVAALDSVRLAPVSVAGRRDTVTAFLAPQSLPDWCSIEPDRVGIRVPLEPGVLRRLAVDVESPRDGSAYRAAPARVTAVVTVPRRLAGGADRHVRAAWRAPASSGNLAGRRAQVFNRVDTPRGVDVRFEPDSVTLRPANR